jgi:oligopeptide/dipeptide ABC transporter ATP-binding protein
MSDAGLDTASKERQTGVPESGPAGAGSGDGGMLLEVDGLKVSFAVDEGIVAAVDGVDLKLAAGEVLALVGESGCGKSVTALALLGVIDMPGRIVGGDIRFQGVSILDFSEDEMRSLRGGQIGIIYQEPTTALNPVLTVGYQVAEAVRAHGGTSRREAAARTRELFDAVGIGDVKRRMAQYPHNLSGGLKQRVMIAMALAGDPKLLIADEPTTALDVTIQAQILELIADLSRSRGLAVLFITHDLGVVAHIAHRVAVMYAGQVVEEGATMAVLTAPRHPYTAALLRSIPSPSQRGGRLAAIGGSLPDPTATRVGCSFAPRCPQVMDVCTRKQPPVVVTGPSAFARCWLAADEGARASDGAPPVPGTDAEPSNREERR